MFDRAGLPLGRIIATPGSLSAMQEALQLPAEFLVPHKFGDWGDLVPEDRAANRQALRDGSRVLSSYRTKQDEKLWVITESSREYTTLLLPEEY